MQNSLKLIQSTYLYFDSIWYRLRKIILHSKLIKNEKMLMVLIRANLIKRRRQRKMAITQPLSFCCFHVFVRSILHRLHIAIGLELSCTCAEFQCITLNQLQDQDMAGLCHCHLPLFEGIL